MRTALFLALFAFASSSFALQVSDLRSLITGPGGVNEYSGSNQNDDECGASLSLRDGQLQGSITYRHTGAGVRAALNSPVKILSNANGVTKLQVSHFNEPEMQMTLTVKNRKVTSIAIVTPNNFAWFDAHVSCNDLVQWTPKPVR